VKKKATYSILATITTILLFTTAAICNMCAPLSSTETSETNTEDINGIYEEESAGTAIEQASQTQQAEQTQESQAQQQSSTTTTDTIVNNPPEITQVITPTNIKTDHLYDIEVEANDPDGDSLNYNWAVSGGTISDPSSNPMTWTAPSTDGMYQITITVDDGNGGIKTEIVSVQVNPYTPLIISGTGIWPIGNGTGYIEDGYRAFNNAYIFAGDSVRNNSVRGFICYDIPSGLTAQDIESVRLVFNNPAIIGDPSFYGDFEVHFIDRQNGPLKLADFNAQGYLIAKYNSSGIGNIEITSDILKNALINNLDIGNYKFHLRIQFSGLESNLDDRSDGLRCKQSNVGLYITFTDLI
jgi:hypothetical protein